MANRVPVYCMDGVRKGRLYEWPEGTREFQINTVVPGNVFQAYSGGGVSGYGGYIYKIYAMWGSGRWVAFFDRLAYRAP